MLKIAQALDLGRAEEGGGCTVEEGARGIAAEGLDVLLHPLLERGSQSEPPSPLSIGYVKYATM